MKTPTIEDPFLREILERADAFFSSATDSEMQDFLGEINYDFYRNVRGPLDEGDAFSEASITIESSRLEETEFFDVASPSVDFRTCINLIEFDLAA